MISSPTPHDHISSMYNAWCQGMHKNDLYGCFYHMMVSRGMTYCVEDVKEMEGYVDAFEYGLDPADPAFCHECRTVLEWFMNAVE